MIKKIKKIKNLGVFSNYQWDRDLTEFERYNLFYGWNGTGKTTLSKLFSCLEQGQSTEFTDLEYEIDAETGIFKNGTAFNRKIKVFNQDYVKNNVELLQGTAKPIFILGEENKAIAEQIEKDGNILTQLKAKKKTAAEEKNKKITERGKKFTDVAKIIGENTSGSSIRNYRKNNAESSFQSLTENKILSVEEKSAFRVTLKQEEKEALSKITIPVTYEEGEEISITDFLTNLFSKCKDLCSQTVESAVIEHLKDNSDISSWVETGISLHEKHDSKECEFCGQILPDYRIQELANHFNEADRTLKKSIDTTTVALNEIADKITELATKDKANLYDELRNEYQGRVDEFSSEKENLVNSVDSLVKYLKNKKGKTTESIELNITLDTEPFEAKLTEVNDQIELHNKKSRNFKLEKENAQNALEKHYLSEIVEGVATVDREIEGYTAEIQILTNGDPSDSEKIGIGDLITRISDNKNKISSEHKACNTLNEKLKTFLGRDEIIFEVAPEGGYRIKRKGNIAKNLSEGEKTAVAFVYFVVHLKDQDFNLSEGIVIIDDPISSLDSNSLFQAFAFLKNSVKGAKQVFLFTHSFDFLRLLLNWLKNVKNSVGKKGYYMIKNQYLVGDDRSAYISDLDRELKNHESEYHYLCKVLLGFKTDGSIASVYHIPNIARKVLETFLMFRVPNGESSFNKLEKLDFDEDKKTAIYKFTNDQSHITGSGFDPSLVPETQKNVSYLLEMMKKVFPEHFDILEKSITNS